MSTPPLQVPTSQHARYLTLLRHVLVRAVEQRFKGSVLGIGWVLLTPVLLMSVYVLVFIFILGNPFEGATKWEHVGSLVIGLSIFNLLAEPIAAAPVVIVRNSSMVKKVVFPTEFLCLAEFAPAVVQFGGNVVVLVIFMLVGGVIPGRNILWLPMILLPGLMLAVGVSLALASLGVFLRDLEHLVQHATRILLYTGAVFYPPDKIPHAVWQIIRFNPLIHIVEQSRRVSIFSTSPSMLPVAYIWIVGVLALTMGLWVFKRLRRQFSNVL